MEAHDIIMGRTYAMGWLEIVIMKIFTLVILLMIIVGGITALVSSHALIFGNIDASYDKIKTVLYLSAVIYFLGHVLNVARAVIRFDWHYRSRYEENGDKRS